MADDPTNCRFTNCRMIQSTGAIVAPSVGTVGVPGIGFGGAPGAEAAAIDLIEFAPINVPVGDNNVGGNQGGDYRPQAEAMEARA